MDTSLTIGGGTGLATTLTGPQKAAIIIQMILSEGGSLPLTSISADGQTRLMEDFVELGRVDRATLTEVVEELEEMLNSEGLSFPKSIADAIDTLEEHLDDAIVADLRRKLGLGLPPVPWSRVAALPTKDIVAMLTNEDIKIAAIILSKLDGEKAADVLNLIDPEQATALAFATQSTGDLSPELLTQIGLMLTESLPTEKPKAFNDAPALRVANLLNGASPDRRDEVLASLLDKDADFAADVRANIFTFGDIANRVVATDIAKITRDIPQDELIMALAYGATVEAEATEFILANMSKRMADALREEMADQDQIAKKSGEAAMGRVTSTIRSLADLGDIKILPPPGSDTSEE